MAAFLKGYLSEQDRVALPRIVALMQDRFDRFALDGMNVSRLLRRVGWQRSYLPEDDGPIIVYRRTPNAGAKP